MRYVKYTGVGVLGLLIVFAASLFVPLDEELLNPGEVTSLRVLDKNGVLLREVLSSQDGRGRWCTLQEIAPAVVMAAIAVEDSRFYVHPGVDPIALGRAALQNARAGRIVSGGSTITMQLVRNLYRPKRTLLAKMYEAWLALRLERMLTKEEILVHYLNRISYSNNTAGIDAAAALYFNKPASQLSLAEASFLMSIPNSPTQYDPYKRLEEVTQRQKYVLARMLAEGMIDAEEYELALHEPIRLAPRVSHFKAPHFTTMVVQRILAELREYVAEIRTTLDYTMQKSVELLLQSHLARLKKHSVTNGAVVVIDNTLHTIVALVGSKDFHDTTIQGQVNGALALRQPGSTLKPFTYALALESGFTAASLLADIPRLSTDTSIDFLPENYDRRFHGPVLLRTALSCSYNVPAVRTLEQIGESRLLEALHAAGIASLKHPAAHYGLGLTLGNGEVSLLELTNAYSLLANGGLFHPIRYIDSVKQIDGAIVSGELYVADNDSLPVAQSNRQVLSPQVSYLLTDILSDPQARAPAFGTHSSLVLPFPAAAKTGTSKDYRDNWTVGYSSRYTVGVWVGNFTGKPMRLVSGITGAAPLFRDVMLFLHADGKTPPFAKPEGIATALICPRSGMRPGRDCSGRVAELFIAGSEPKEVCTVHKRLRIDSRNGLLASRSTPKHFVEERTFETFPPIFNSWAEAEGLPQPPREAMDVAAQLPLLINSPVTGEVFKLDPVLRKEFQTIMIEAIVNAKIDDVALLVNGRAVTTLRPPFRYRLPLTDLPKGEYTLMLRGKQGNRAIESAPVQLAVQ